MPLIRKHARVLALLAAVMAAIAAPYMIPENPDSAAFRSGSLSLILLLTGAFPVYRAILRLDRRMLVCSLTLGYLFAAALSLGSELLIYDGLLHGLGSLVRRTAVPVLAAPYLGCLFAFVMYASPKAGRIRIPLWGYALAIFLCWLPVLLAYFPGMLNYDFAGEYMQHIDHRYSNIHPLLHSAVMNGVITLGEMLGSKSFGLLLMSLLQMSLFALSLGYSCTFAQRRGASVPVLLAMTALYALHPVFSVMALSMTKDTLFACAILTLSLLTWELIESPQEFLARKPKYTLYVLCAVNTALMRNNGVFALALLLPGVIAALPGFRKQATKLAACCAAASLAVLGLLTLLLSPQEMPSFQLYSLPAQQLVRAAASGEMAQEEVDALRSWYTDDAGMVVHPHLADPAKGYLDKERIEREGGDFLAMWANHLPKHAHAYIEAFLMLNVGSWYPDDLSHSTIYPDVSWNDKGYLQTQEYDMSEYGLSTRSLLPAVRNFYEQICRRNAYQKYPVISVLFNTAIPFWALMLACSMLIARRRTRYLPALMGCMGLWLSYLFGPCTLPRYMLPLFCLAPPALAASILTPSSRRNPPCS